ncbi:hypothetical protein ABZ477_15615 [Microbacterium sp. NPDC019599]|uniref:DUF7882 family protein n=1 Tax=Microbacterium sp. NPDC019599 TaxID=3154690 RepID=UPI0033D35EA9
MGYLYYGAETHPTEVPDRILAHLRVVATTKLRRGESFTLTWRHPDGGPEGRTSIWVQPAIPLKFVFDSADPEQLDTHYLQALAEAANTSSGITIDWTDQPAPLSAVGAKRAVAAA